jgi:hypothetical protein
MEPKAARVISEKQKKVALSSVLKKAKQPKNVLISNDVDYWPSLDEQQSKSFVDLLET